MLDIDDFNVTASIGLAVSDLVPGTQLIERADQALYRAKRTGKNRVVDAGA